MGDDANCPEGRPARLPALDPARAHLVTLVSREGALLFGRVAQAQVVPAEAGRVVAEEWQRLSQQVPGVRAGELVVMPNHVHGLIYVGGPGRKKGQRGSGRRRASDAALLGTAITRLKAAVTRRVNALGGPGTGSVWQAGYRDVAVESPQELVAVRRLIRQDPARWAEDVENPSRRATAPGTSRRARA